MMTAQELTELVRSGAEPTVAQALALSEFDDLPVLMNAAAELRDRGHGSIISYSKKVFIPLTKLCRDFLPLLHLCPTATADGDGLSVAGGGAGDRSGGRAGGLPRGPVHAGRQAGAALPRRRAPRSTSSATPPRSIISPPWRRWCSRRPACCRTSIPA